MRQTKDWEDECGAELCASLDRLRALPEVAEVLLGKGRAYSHRYRPGALRIVGGGVKGYSLTGSYDVFIILKQQDQQSRDAVRTVIDELAT